MGSIVGRLRFTVRSRQGSSRGRSGPLRHFRFVQPCSAADWCERNGARDAECIRPDPAERFANRARCLRSVGLASVPPDVLGRGLRLVRLRLLLDLDDPGVAKGVVVDGVPSRREAFRDCDLSIAPGSAPLPSGGRPVPASRYRVQGDDVVLGVGPFTKVNAGDVEACVDMARGDESRPPRRWGL